MVLFFSALFLSFVNAEASFVVPGIVLDLNQEPVFNAKVALENEEGEEIGYFEPTDAKGRFELRFNAVEGKPLTIRIKKQHFHPVEREIIPSSSKQEYPEMMIELVPDHHYTLKTSNKKD